MRCWGNRHTDTLRHRHTCVASRRAEGGHSWRIGSVSAGCKAKSTKAVKTLTECCTVAAPDAVAIFVTEVDGVAGAHHHDLRRWSMWRHYPGERCSVMAWIVRECVVAKARRMR